MKALRRAGERELSDDRILGSGDFVEQIIKEAEANVRYQFSVKEQSKITIEWTHKRKNSHYISMIR
ncbi:hypothetical protein D1AOALGA4SA_12926 [Olavius algarvensis Delta 1 endosymbiont]|nr:hypothetical protein D1AOALGA4SA_12926 [Olavius algarvensis Delta 1 endosymbiont]